MSNEKQPEKKEEEEIEFSEETPKPSGQQAKEQQNKNFDFWTFLSEKALPLFDKFLTLKKDETEGRTKYFESVAKHNRKMVYVLTGFLAIIIALMSALTYGKLISGDALLFLVGTITGYLLLF